ncbi:MAG: non-ribosomal peptide synthetase [Dokdonella sp.]
MTTIPEDRKNAPDTTAAGEGWTSSAPFVLVDYAIRLDSAALEQRTNSLAAGLSRRGVTAVDRVGIAVGSRLNAVVAILACRRIGAVYVPLDPQFPAARLALMLDAAMPALLIVDTATRSAFPVDTALLELTGDGTFTPSTSAAHVLTRRGDIVEGDDALAYVLFTSGSTGVPKGVAMRSAAVDHLIRWHVDHPRLGRAARTLQFAPLGFDVSYQEIFATRATGGSLVVPSDAERRDPYALLDLLARERVERLFLPFVGLQALAEAVATGGTMPADLRDVVTAGEQLRITPALRSLFAALPGAALHNHYGPTETHVVTALELTGDPSAWPELPSIGTPLPHVRILLVDDQLNEVAEGEEGELLLGGDCLAAGYASAPELTHERFIKRDGARWYRTGDRARRDHEGHLHYLGRLDQQIKLDGFRVEPAEIEIVLGRHPGIAEAVVVASTSAGASHLVAHVVARDADADQQALLDSLREHASGHLASYLLPRQFHVHAALPLTASGKVDRRALARQADEQSLTWPDDASLEEQMTVMWQQLLDVTPIAAHDNLFDHGARSLTVVRALTQLRKHGHVLSAAQVYDQPSIAGLVRMLGNCSGTDRTVAAASTRGERQRDALSRFGPRGGSR